MYVNAYTSTNRHESIFMLSIYERKNFKTLRLKVTNAFKFNYSQPI